MKTVNFLLRRNLFGALLFCLLATSLSAQSNIQQSLSVNSTGTAADASAQLDVSATDKGMLVPRMTSAQRLAIVAPAPGLLVFDLTTNGFWYSLGAAWVNLSSHNMLVDADGNTKVQVEENFNEDIIRFDLEGTESMVLKKNADGSPRLELPNALSNTFIGIDAGQANTTGLQNTAIGKSALNANTGGVYNTALGGSALLLNTTGSFNIATGGFTLRSNTTGYDNTANGYQAMFSNTTGNENTASGRYALYSNTTGSLNTANGKAALQSNTTGVDNTANGYQALLANTTGNSNTATGSSSLFANTTGIDNTADGYQTLYSNKANSRNTAIGYRAMFNADDRTIGIETYNTALGYEALKGSNTAANNTGTFNTAVGGQVLYSNTTGVQNTAIGKDALYSNTTGDRNTASGASALYSNTIGQRNTASGIGALYFNTMGINNTANGAYVLYNNITGENNTANGNSALHSSTTGHGNTGTGAYTLQSNISGDQNTANGIAALHSNTTGESNTAIGAYALQSNTTGDLNTALGFSADVATSNLTKATAIGYNSTVGCSNCLTLGGTGTDAVDVGIGIASPEVKLHVVDGTDVSLAGGGYILTGSSTGLNIGMDDNEIMARNNGAAATLFLNNNGGDVVISAVATNVGIGRIPITNNLEVNGTASKSSAGDWLANSDARLKKNIQPLNSQLMLQNLLALQGVTYEWDDDKTGSKRPVGIQYGFTAQNIQQVFPTLVEEDKLGYLQTAYGTYDAMTVEAIRALNDKIVVQQAEIGKLEQENANLKTELHGHKSQLDNITSALQGAGIAVEK